jgi:mevalonate kinase
VPVVLPATKATKTDKDYQAAINMGAAVADALASIVKKDKDNFLKNVSQAQEFGKQLGISEKVMGKYKAITAAAEKN